MLKVEGREAFNLEPSTLNFSNKNASIYIAGHSGLVGGAIMRLLQRRGYTNIITRSSSQLDLCEHAPVKDFFEKEKPEYIFLAAAKVGGIMANNTYPAEFIYSNLTIQNNIIHEAYRNGVKKLLFLGSSCIYPRMAPQPIKEEYLLTGPLEYTNEPYAIAKIAGIKMCDAYRDQYGCNFISVMPTNLYGPNDNYDLKTSHVIAALLRKIHEAKVNNQSSVTLWGTGEPRREFLHVDDLADASVFLMKNYNEQGLMNVGTGKDLTINELAAVIKNVVGYTGKIEHDTSKPDGTPRKLLDVSKLSALGWIAKINLEDGLRKVYKQYVQSASVVA